MQKLAIAVCAAAAIALPQFAMAHTTTATMSRLGPSQTIDGHKIAGRPNGMLAELAEQVHGRSGPRADRLNLGRIQQKVAWADLSSHLTSQSRPAGFKIIAGATAPSTVTIRKVTKKTAGDVPALRRYDFAIVQGKLLIINPSDRKVVEVIRKGSFFA
jgi:Protein of unknown function (DUF1236)